MTDVIRDLYPFGKEMSSTVHSVTGMGSGIGRAVFFGLELAALAAAITALVIYIKNDRNKTNPNYKKPSWWNVAIAAGITFVIGFVLSEIKHRLQENKFVSTTTAGLSNKYQKWWNPSTATPEPSIVSAAPSASS